MALVGFMGPTSYSVISAKYAKTQKSVLIQIDTFMDETKSIKLNTMQLNLYGHLNMPVIKSLTTSAAPADAVSGDVFFIPSNAVGRWAGHEGQQAWLADNADWVFSPATWFGEQTFFIADEGKYKKLVNGSWIEDLLVFDGNTFAKWFDVSMIGGEGMDILKRCYQYLLSRPDFAHCSVD